MTSKFEFHYVNWDTHEVKNFAVVNFDQKECDMCRSEGVPTAPFDHEHNRNPEPVLNKEYICELCATTDFGYKIAYRGEYSVMAKMIAQGMNNIKKSLGAFDVSK